MTEMEQDEKYIKTAWHFVLTFVFVFVVFLNNGSHVVVCSILHITNYILSLSLEVNRTNQRSFSRHRD